ncbi:GNAT family N-acetyltransferase [Faecalibacterium sp. An122]|uniref:GNAT family N-acetyltransferase n=1 Tax=Faecalibacterium sp. An122 TaxID=1965551 RepID=UPI000B3A9A4B|nr:GNAT family N-acetyltransferase [Faecalibacterium sp. An122]OUQ39380.1 hypothetical protein B5E67_02400 [Faecalibacterium sp. An122]
MSAVIQLKPYQNETDTALSLIQAFWLRHSHVEQTAEEAARDLKAWTGDGHAFYLIQRQGQVVGFLHLGSRGGPIDWLEELFILPAWQNQGIGTEVIRQAEEMVRAYSDAVHIEAVARNEGAIRLYRRLGYDCLNSITIRKDLRDTGFRCVRQEKLYDLPFEIRKKD